MKAFVLVLALLVASPAFAEPCAVVTSSVTSYRPRTPLEHVYYSTSVCWRKRALDAESLVRSATTSLAAREVVLVPAPALEPSSPLTPWLFAGAGALVGALVCALMCPRLHP